MKQSLTSNCAFILILGLNFFVSACDAPTPVYVIPEGAMLNETALAETALAETALAETALAETALAEAALAETALAETTLAETALAETALAMPTCITADDILVEFHISRNGEMIDTLSPGETLLLSEKLSLEPDWYLNFKVEITPIKIETLPTFEYAWMNTGIESGKGELLHNTGDMVDYRSNYNDEISMQLSQPDCSALATYSFLILPNATYDICDYGGGKVRVTLYPPDDKGEYTFSRSKEFDAQRGDRVGVVVKSKDGRVWAGKIHIEINKDYPNCSSPSEEKPDDNGDGGGDGGVIPPAPY